LDPATIVISVVVLLLSLSVHEAAHAWTAYRLGDPTAQQLGRLSLNPLVHIDMVGTVLLPVIALSTGAPLIGWAKPVPVNTARLRSGRWGLAAVTAAGPASNLVMAVAAALLLRAVPGLVAAPAEGAMDVRTPLLVFAYTAVSLNVLLALFNMIPVPPLDGGNILGALLPPRLGLTFARLRPYGIFILYGLILTGALSAIIGPPYLWLERFLTS